MNPENAIPRKKKLVASTVAVETLGSEVRDTAFALFQETYAGANRERFEKDLAEKQLMILLHDRDTKALKGFSTVLVQELPGKRHGIVIFSGDTVIHRDYWGQKQLQIAFSRILISHKTRSPRRDVYWFLLSKGYRTYLLLANAFPRAVPRHDTADDPYLRATLDELAASRFGAQYRRELGVVRYATAHEHVRAGLAPITTRHLENPHVQFFVERNPGHENGDELACLAEVRWRDLLRIAARIAAALVGRAFGQRRDARRGQRWGVRPAEGT
jgi:hypothetical protein